LTFFTAFERRENCLILSVPDTGLCPVFTSKHTLTNTLSTIDDNSTTSKTCHRASLLLWPNEFMLAVTDQIVQTDTWARSRTHLRYSYKPSSAATVVGKRHHLCFPHRARAVCMRGVHARHEKIISTLTQGMRLEVGDSKFVGLQPSCRQIGRTHRDLQLI
jgi:hypothetical protein